MKWDHIGYPQYIIVCANPQYIKSLLSSNTKAILQFASIYWLMQQYGINYPLSTNTYVQLADTYMQYVFSKYSLNMITFSLLSLFSRCVKDKKGLWYKLENITHSFYVIVAFFLYCMYFHFFFFISF